MDRGEKVAYYCSELGSRSGEQNHHINNSINNNNNNNNNVGKFDIKEKHNDQHQMQNSPEQEALPPLNGGESSIRNNRYNNSQKEQPIQLNEQNIQVVQNQILEQQQIHQSLNLSSTTTQPQYLISNNNQQHLTNVTPLHFNQHLNNNSFQNQILSANYHMNSNHHLYQGNLQQQQQQQQTRTALFQHHKTPSFGEDGQPKVQNQIMANETLNKPQLNQVQSQNRQTLNVEQSNLTTSQSMTQNDFNRIRNKSEQLDLNREVGLEGLNLDLDAMFTSNGQNTNNNNNLALKLQPSNSGQNIDKLIRTMGIQGSSNNAESMNAGSEMNQVVDYGHQQNKDSPYMVYNKSEDNIYEELDFMTVNRLQQEYNIDAISSHSDTWKKKNAKKFLGASFTRWFSTRKKSSNSQNSDKEDNLYLDSRLIKRPRLISLPDRIPDNLTPEKLKRRLIVGSMVDSENSYTNSLFRLVYEYKKPLEESDPPILSRNKIETIFNCLEQILQFHTLFGIAMCSQVQEWDEKEMIGHIFTAQLSKPMVLDIYSQFINNFTNAMETARKASKSKAFAQFLHDKSVTSPDRLSFFGSMVKPVQRFPQFILLLSDLLKHTPFNHPDRMPLQRALTELESLADRLNERKRAAERHFAVKQLLKDHLTDSNAHIHRILLRQDDTLLLDMDPTTNTILKSKSRKMYLLNDILICVSTPSNRLKFAVQLEDITVVESITPAISDLLAHSNLKNLNDNLNTPHSPQFSTIERMESERQSLVCDLELMMQITQLVALLRFQYNGLNPAVPEQICIGIREEIRKKEFQMTLIDRCCLQLRLHSKNNKDILVVKFNSPEQKRDWLIDFRLTKLALIEGNNPHWEYGPGNPPPIHRVPLFVKSLAIFKSEQSQLTCALHYYLRQAPFIGENPAGVLWICNVNVGASSLGALATNGAEVSLIHSYELSDSHVTCLESVGSTLWIGLRQGRIIVIDANSPSEWHQFASLDVKDAVTCIKHFGHYVYVGLTSGSVAVFDPFKVDQPHSIQLGTSPVTCLMPINDEIFACCHNRVWRIKETHIVDSFLLDRIIPVDCLEEEPRPNLLAHCGNGIWVSMIDSPIVKLYHTESLKHLVDINVETSIREALRDKKNQIKITVTSMMTSRGLLWIGTNVGIVVTLTLPRLQGVPVVSGSMNVALHRFLGPVNIMLNLSAGSECVPQLPYNSRQYIQQLKLNHLVKNEDAEAIYGQYADLMNVGDYISSGRKSSNLGDNQGERMPWELPNQVNMPTMNTSDDSASNASSGAMYQDGIARGMKQVRNKAVITNAAMGTCPQQQTLPNQMMPNILQAVQNTQAGINDPNHVYDKAQSHSMTYNQGSLNSVPQMAQNLSEGVSLDRLQQAPMMSSSQSQLGKNEPPNSQVSDYGSQSGKTPSKLYDRPAQLIQQQQQIIQQSRQAAGQVDNSMLNNMQPPMLNYGTIANKSKSYMGNKTVLVLVGGNGYQRIVEEGDNRPFGEHAHCIIWEYKA